MNYAEALKKVHLFKDLPAADLDKLAAVGTEYVLPSHTTLFSEGESGDEMFAILRGTAKILKKNAKGEPEEVATLGTNSYFGEMAFIIDEHTRSATLETQEDCVVLGFKQDDLLKILAKDDRLAHRFYRALAVGLARRLMATTRDTAFYKAVALKHV
ncbi:MAG: cyclic nucleotide-binding domain-containing protein [Deltaproteobacteria bacterium]|nr:cyclic nucleotide-binding domain-containing protein [Deltaproteobacteria bacterium]